jgi:hypothetical protein
VTEVGDDGRTTHDGRFDGDDFEGAYRELERRYYAGEGAAHAESGATLADGIVAMNNADFDRLLGELSVPELRVENRSRSPFLDRSVGDLRDSFGDLDAMMASVRTWLSAVCWLSPAWGVTRLEREAVGSEGEHYAWTRLLAIETRDGRVASISIFEPDDEEQAFAVAEERMRATSSRLAITNRASEMADAVIEAMQAHDVDASLGCCSDQYVYDDRRRLSGDPIEGGPGLRAALERIFAQFTGFEGRTLAVRGERLALRWSRWSDDAGNVTAHLHVFEVGDDGRIAYQGRFDEDDFEGAYRELERRYFAGEGAAFAKAGAVGTNYLVAFNQGDFDRVFGELTAPEMRLESRSPHSVFTDRSIAEFRTSVEELNSMVASARTWHSAMCWLSPTCAVTRRQREAVGLDGEHYAWTQIVAYEIRDDRLRWACQFDPDDEEQAFAVAEERIRATQSRLAVGNRASQAMDGVYDAMRARNATAATEFYTDGFTYDDRRRFTGDPIDNRASLLATAERIRAQYTQFEVRTLAVRGERLGLCWTRWSDDAGNETTNLHVTKVGDDGRITYEGRFDDDDFEGAYRELDCRYYAGEGAAYAESGATVADSIVAVNSRDFDRLFGELCLPELRVKSRTLSAFPDRSASELRDSFGDLNAMVASTRTWLSAVCWVSPVWSVTRLDRDAVGPEGEQYAWSRLLVIEMRDGRLASLCEFELDDEEAAFAFVEQRGRAAACDNRSIGT